MNDFWSNSDPQTTDRKRCIRAHHASCTGGLKKRVSSTVHAAKKTFSALGHPQYIVWPTRSDTVYIAPSEEKNLPFGQCQRKKTGRKAVFQENGLFQCDLGSFWKKKSFDFLACRRKKYNNTEMSIFFLVGHNFSMLEDLFAQIIYCGCLYYPNCRKDVIDLQVLKCSYDKKNSKEPMTFS